MRTCLQTLRFFLFLIFAVSLYGTQAQTWTDTFRKLESNYDKGKFKKIPKKTAKIRKKGSLADSTLAPWLSVLDAKAYEAMKQYEYMNNQVSAAGIGLASILSVDTTRYVEGQLRLIDLYTDYGNYRLADSICAEVESHIEPTYYDSWLGQEVKLRRAIIEVFNGRFGIADSVISELELSMPKYKYEKVGFDEPSKYELIHRNNQIGELTVSKIRILLEKGLYAQADSLYDATRKDLLSELDNKKSAYFKYVLLRYDIAYQFGDLRKAERYLGRYFNANPAGNRKEDGLFRKVQLAVANNSNADVIHTRNMYLKYSKKIKAPREYQKLHFAYFDAFDNFLNDKYDQAFRQINDGHFVSSKIVPLDHASRQKLYNAGIRFSENSKVLRYQQAANSYYPYLRSSLEQRFSHGYYLDILDIRQAGYFMEFTETPIEAFNLLDRKPYKFVFSQMSPGHKEYSYLVGRINEYLVINGFYEEGVQLNQLAVDGMIANPYTSLDKIGMQMVALAKMQTKAGMYKDAEGVVDEAIKLVRKGGERVSGDFVVALNAGASVYAAMGIYDKAETLLTRSKAIGKKLENENKTIMLNSIEDLAVINTRLGNFSETEELLTEVIKEKSDMYGGFSRRLIKPYDALGQMYLIKGDFPSAEKNLRKSLSITDHVYGDSTLYYSDYQSHLVDLYLKLGNYKAGLINAYDVYEKRKQKLKDDHILIAESLTKIGLLRLHAGDDLNTVKEYFLSAKEIVESNFDDNHPLYAEAIKNLSYVLIEEGELDSALVYLDKADQIWSDALGSRNRSSGEVAQLKGDIYSYQRQFIQAKKEYQRASRFFKRIFSADHPDYLSTLSKLAQSFYIDGELAKVEKTLDNTTASYLNYTREYFPSLSEEEKAEFWNKIKSDFEFYNTVAVDYKDEKPKYIENMYDFALATKGLLLSSSIKTRNAIMNSGDQELIMLFEEWVLKKEDLTNALGQSEESEEEPIYDVKKLKDEIAALEKELSEKSEDFASTFDTQIYDWKDISGVLGEHEAAVEIVRYRAFDEGFNDAKINYAALIVTQETKKNPELVLLSDGLEMESKHFKRLRNSIKFKVRDENAYKVYWEQIAQAVGNKSVVYFSPDGIYNQINLESLATPDGQYVIDKTNIRVVNSTKTLAISRSRKYQRMKRKSRPENPVAMLFGNPKYYENPNTYEETVASNPTRAFTSKVAQLPGTEKEVKVLSDILEENNWRVDTYLGDDATEDVIKNIKDVTLLHIATHGFFDERPKSSKQHFGLFDDDNPLERSGLLTRGAGEVLLEATNNYNISDGVLTAYEAMNLNFEKTELVVLSACETGRGEIEQGEGVFGLQRSFLVAGADALIMSLFQVSDEVTQLLMVEFYKHWLAGKTKREAFNEAQLTIKSQYPDPIYWGAFLMVAKE